MVLDALIKIKNEQDPTLTFRRYALAALLLYHTRRLALAVLQILSRGHLRFVRHEH
jgi:hypothetical protein